MSSPVTAVRAQIKTTWEALTPPDRAGTTYHAVESRKRLRGDAGDRSFFLDLPIRLSPLAENGVDASQVEWVVRAEVRLTQAGRSVDDLFDATANESNLLARAIEKTSSWPSGVIGVITGDIEPTIDEDSGDALLNFELHIHTAETD